MYIISQVGSQTCSSSYQHLDCFYETVTMYCHEMHCKINCTDWNIVRLQTI